MQTAKEELKEYMKYLRVTEGAGILDDLLMEAEQNNYTYLQFLQKLFTHEVEKREEKALQRRLKQAAFPEHKTLEEFDVTQQKSISQKQLNQLKELEWLEQVYNLILLGPPGTGKSHLVIGLGREAVYRGYKVSFVTMDNLVQLLKTQEVTRSSQTKIKRIISSDLVIIDDLMFMAMDRNEGNLFFQLINKLYNRASIIITSNKGPEDWGELLGDQAVATAILDRIIHKSEVLNLTGESYRINNRLTIFENN